MKVVIFGGSGFVGYHLKHELTKRRIAWVSCDLDKGIPLAGGLSLVIDVSDVDLVNSVPIERDDVVVNLAANQYHRKVPKKGRENYFHDVNVKGTENILSVMCERGCHKFIMFSTDMIYGKPQYLPVDTNHPQNPFGPYGQSKKKAESICRDFRDKGVNVTIFRPRMIIGPGRLGILEKLFSLIERDLPVPMIGYGENCYQMISVFDCVAAILLAIEIGCPNYEYNLGSLNPPTIKHLLKDLIVNVGSKSVVLRTPAKLVKFMLSGFSRFGIDIMYPEQFMIADENYILDIEKTRKELGWIPRYSDSDMISAAYHDFKANRRRKDNEKL